MNDQKSESLFQSDGAVADSAKPLDKAALERIEELTNEVTQNVGGGMGAYHYAVNTL